MSSTYVDLHSFIHGVEQWRLPICSHRRFVTTVAVGIPIAVLLHDTYQLWGGEWFETLPVVRYFARSWKQNPETKAIHLQGLRNAILLGWLVVTSAEKYSNETAFDFVTPRLTNSTTRQNLTTAIQEARVVNCEGAMHTVLPVMEDNNKVLSTQDAEYRRRYQKEGRQ